MNEEPICDLNSIITIKKLLADKPHDLCLFTFGIHTGLSADEIVSLKGGQVDHLKTGDQLKIRQTKSGNYRSVTINKTVSSALHNWLAVHPDLRNDGEIFVSQYRRKTLTVSAMSNSVKRWCHDINLKGHYGSHTLRKTWGYHHFLQNKDAMTYLMEVFGHMNQAQTLEYLCIQDGQIHHVKDLGL